MTDHKLKFPMGKWQSEKLQEVKEKVYRELDVMASIELIHYLAESVYDEISWREVDEKHHPFTEDDKSTIQCAMMAIQEHADDMTDGAVHRFYNID